MFVFLRCFSKRLIHLLTEILVYDFILRLTTDLFSLCKLYILLSKLPKFLKLKLLIVPMRRDKILAKGFAVLWGADQITEIFGSRRIPRLWVLGRS